MKLVLTCQFCFLLFVSPLIANADGAAPVAESGPSPFHNPGVYKQIVNDRLYEWIPTQDVNFEIQPDGKVRIVAPLTKTSFNGKNKCRRFLYDHLHRRLADHEEAALFADGLMLPCGSFGFAIQWIKAENYDQVLAEPWNLTSNPDTYQDNSAQLDYFYLSIVPLKSETKASEVEEVALPTDLQRVSWLPHYQVLAEHLHLPADKGFGVTRLLWDIPLEKIYKKVTHIQYCYEELDHVPAAKKWITKQGLDNSGQVTSNEWLIENHPIDRDFITAAQLDETFGSRGLPNHVERAQQILEGIYERTQKELGITSPNQTRIYDDYFTALEGYDNSVNFSWRFNADRFTEGLASESMARRMYRDDNWIQECRYFSDDAYKYRNRIEGGYLDSFPICPEGMRVYNQIYNYERKFLAITDRKVLKFSWSNAEGCSSTMYRHGVKSRLHFDDGDIIRTDVVAWPFQMMLTESFWSLLLGNDFVLWHSNIRLVQDPLAFDDSGAAGAGKTQWQPSGGKMVDYDPADPKQPQRKAVPRAQFPNNPHLGESGAFAGAWLVGQITEVSDRASKTVEYCPFQYRVNGGDAQTGYADSNWPQKGELGDASLSRYGVANAGQANIVSSFVAKKPICILTEGKDGTALIFHNVYSGLTDRSDVTILTKTGRRTVSVQGNDLHVFLLD